LGGFTLTVDDLNSRQPGSRFTDQTVTEQFLFPGTTGTIEEFFGERVPEKPTSLVREFPLQGSHSRKDIWIRSELVFHHRCDLTNLGLEFVQNRLERSFGR
jgi:hypothetical protein